MSKREQSVFMIARIVERLAENGVIEESLSSHDLIVDNPTNDEVQLFVDAIKWLRSEGVIRADQGYSGSRALEVVFDASLTSKGHWLLDQRLTNDLTLGAAIRNVNRSEPSATGIGDFIGGILGGFTKSVSS